MTGYSSFEISKNGIDPASVPYKVTNTGDRIPLVGLGTFGSDKFSGEQIATTVKDAISKGYRHLDCASVYGNEKEIGKALKEVFDSGLVKREELWITSKVWNDKHGDGDVLRSCAESLKDLQIDYLDLYLIHWPFPNFHAPGCDVSARNPDSKPYIHENYMKTWRQMEGLCKTGLVRNIGTSNMTIPKMKLLLRDCDIRPACSEMELHPHFQQEDLFIYTLDNQIIPIGYSPVGSPARPERDRTPADTVDTEDPVILRIARRLEVHPAVVCIRWAIQRGQIPIPFSTTPGNYLANLKAAISGSLTNEEMDEIKGIDKNCRLVKGHVFLWKDGQTWQDLWDMDGEITPA
jgi:alcohol dehydrogenase (NADP+)